MKADLKRLTFLARIKTGRIADHVSSDEFVDQLDNQSRTIAIVAIVLALAVILIPAFLTLYERGLLWTR